MPTVYKKSTILDLFYCENEGGEYYVATVDTNFCMNIGREHGSNRIYYYINTKAIYQKCFCTCDTTEGRMSGNKCKDYRSSGRNMSLQLKYLLFPREKQKSQDQIKTNSAGSDNHNRDSDEIGGATLKQLEDVLDSLYDQIYDQRDMEDLKYSGK